MLTVIFKRRGAKLPFNRVVCRWMCAACFIRPDADILSGLRLAAF
ncbi:hypothetical protein AEST_31550 [Alishewanella aestuarii B11]|uniref:Uncharacterized protein n=1 Tax=Alishewanella aestuarii B11 TaxID=1197174 RepID=J2IBC4_9ALTE|nr:hypothetical protein AEST_31550 [Alishewanella aestuarii B11]